MHSEFIWPLASQRCKQMIPTKVRAHYLNTYTVPLGLKFLLDLILQPFFFQSWVFLIGGLSLNNWTLITLSGAFNSYVEKKRWVVISRKSTLGHINKELVLCKMSIIVHSSGVGVQNRVKIVLRSFWMPHCNWILKRSYVFVSNSQYIVWIYSLVKLFLGCAQLWAASCIDLHSDLKSSNA